MARKIKRKPRKNNLSVSGMALKNSIRRSLKGKPAIPVTRRKASKKLRHKRTENHRAAEARLLQSRVPERNGTVSRMSGLGSSSD